MSGWNAYPFQFHLGNIRLAYTEGAENDGHENDGSSKLQGMKLQDMKNISLLLFLPIPVILAVLWKI